MKRTIALFLLVLPVVCGAERRAKNVILFLGDAGGIPTLSAASAYAHKEPQKLFIQSMPNIGLSDTTPAGAWVTDSAAGMTAIVTGQKTHNGVISQGADAVRGSKDGAALKTILEYAEERGLATGVMSNMNMTDATPAACYAHANDRKKSGEIFADLLKPRFGDGVDVMIGNGRDAIFAATRALGIDPEAALKERGYELSYSPEELPNGKRIVALFNGGDFDLARAVRHATGILSRNGKGYFLMVEWDMHTTNVKRGLDRVVTMDNVIRETAGRVPSDTLILFTADHSFDLRLRGGRRDADLIPAAAAAPGGDSAAPAAAAAKAPIRVENSHTGEEVLVAAKGPGAERVKGFMKNTDIFRVMLAAYGWQ
jgi:alkaline phosphatase